MSMTVQDILQGRATPTRDSGARRLLKDADPGTRWGDACLIAFLNAAVQEIRRLRPNTQVDSEMNLISMSFATSLADTVILPDEYEMALVEYVCFLAHSTEPKDENDETMAVKHLVMFKSLIG